MTVETNHCPGGGPPPKPVRRRTELAILCVLLLVALAIRIWLVDVRWINPDEGAHLMDGRLILNGLVPDVDFGARQVLYAHLTGFAIWILGSDLFHLRYFPIVVTLTAGAVLHLIGRRLFGWKVGLLAAGLFLLLPFSTLLTVQTKTEPLAILGASGAVYAMVRSSTGPNRRVGWLVLSGACLGAAFYIRQSTISLLPALILALGCERRWRWREIARSSGFLLLGLAGFTGLVHVYYLRFLPLSEALGGELSNPVSFIVDNAAGAVAGLGGSGGASTEALLVSDRLTLARSFENLAVAGRVCLVLLLGAVAAVVLLVVRRSEEVSGETVWRYSVPALWVSFMALAYAFWTVKRGFYPAYFLELTAPLSLLAAAGVEHCWRHLPGDQPPRAHLLVAATLVLVFGLFHVLADTRQISRPLYFFVTAMVLAAFYLRPGRDRSEAGDVTSLALTLAGIVVLAGVAAAIGPHLPTAQSGLLYLVSVAATVALLMRAGRGLWSRPVGATAFVAYVFVVASFVLSLSESTVHLGLRYQSVWSPETVREVSRYLEQHTAPGDEVLSGAVIWQLQAGRPPFANVSHPLSLRGGTTEPERRHLLAEFRASPPAAVVMDGYTEQTFVPILPDLEASLETNFRHVTTVSGSRYPVSLYLRAGGR